MNSGRANVQSSRAADYASCCDLMRFHRRARRSRSSSSQARRSSSPSRHVCRCHSAISSSSRRGTSGTPPKWPEQVFAELEHTQAQLAGHVDRLHVKVPPSGLSPFDLIGRISLLKARGTSTPDFLLARASGWSKAEIDDATKRAERLGEQLRDAGVPAAHPWRGMGVGTPDMLMQDRLRPRIEAFSRYAEHLAHCVEECRAALALAADKMGTFRSGWMGFGS